MKAKDAANLLNKLLKEQPEFTKELIDMRVKLSESFVESDLPFVCARHNDGFIYMGVLGVVNGMVSDGIVAALIDIDGNIARFEAI